MLSQSLGVKVNFTALDYAVVKPEKIKLAWMFTYLSNVASKVNKQINKDTVMIMNLKQRKWLPAIRQSVFFRVKKKSS